MRAPSSAARSMLRGTLASARRRTWRSLAVNPPSLKTAWLNRLVVAISTTRPVSASAFVKRSSVSCARPSSGTRSSSWKLSAAAPIPASRSTAYTGSIGGRTGPPKTSTPCQPTVQRPNENRSSGVGAGSAGGIADSWSVWSRTGQAATRERGGLPGAELGAALDGGEHALDLEAVGGRTGAAGRRGRARVTRSTTWWVKPCS